jgi:hypothetical protein
MLARWFIYKNYHDDPTKPPFPWDPEAARWIGSTDPNILMSSRLIHKNCYAPNESNWQPPAPTSQAFPTRKSQAASHRKERTNTITEKIHLIQPGQNNQKRRPQKLRLHQQPQNHSRQRNPKKSLIPNLFKKQDKTKSDKAKTPPPDKDKKSHIRLK